MWVQISIVEAGAIASILFSSWPSADHVIVILCCSCSAAALYSDPCCVAADLTADLVILLGLESDAPSKSQLCSCNAPCSHPRQPPAAALLLAVVMIMIEFGGEPRYGFD